MTEINKTFDENNNPILNVDLDTDNIILATADTYVDKNIVINIPLSQKADLDTPAFLGIPTTPTAEPGTKNLQIANTKFVNDNFVLKTGDTMTGPLKFNTTTRPILDLHIAGTNLSNVFALTTNGSIYVGDATSTGGARLYFARNIDKLNTALLTGVSIGYNPKDQINWSSTSDYGIKFDVNVASNKIANTSAQFQAASFFIGLNGAYIGYSGDHHTALTADKVYRILDSNSIKQDEYIKNLEDRIAVLEEIINNNNIDNINNID